MLKNPASAVRNDVGPLEKKKPPLADYLSLGAHQVQADPTVRPAASDSDEGATRFGPGTQADGGTEACRRLRMKATMTAKDGRGETECSDRMGLGRARPPRLLACCSFCGAAALRVSACNPRLPGCKYGLRNAALASWWFVEITEWKTSKLLRERGEFRMKL